ncbi:OsmC family protein [Advenella sp. RU8]|uniref:OsmC family protein n=1 Tax=Advenella sp. RU8 TaxID=3399575 RepID=UPI003AABA34C
MTNTTHTTDTAATFLNGINSEQVRKAQEQMRVHPDGEVSRPTYAAKVLWKSGYRTEAQLSGGLALQGDEPVMYGGQGSGATPQDLLLAAVGHCLTATYVGGLSAAGIRVDHLEVLVSGRVNFRAAYGVERGQPGFEKIEVKVNIQTDAPQERVDGILKKLLPTAPIPDTILRPVPLTVDVVYQSDLAVTAV